MHQQGLSTYLLKHGIPTVRKYGFSRIPEILVELGHLKLVESTCQEQPHFVFHNSTCYEQIMAPFTNKDLL